MRIDIPYSKKRYLYELRQQMGEFTDFWSERFTGIFLGSLIYVTHHAGHEWNRKITNEKSRAIGFVKKRGDGCMVYAITTRGYLELLWMLWFYLLGCVLCLFSADITYRANVHVGAAIFSVFMGVSSYLECWFTERGQQGMRELISILRNPTRFWVDPEE